MAIEHLGLTAVRRPDYQEGRWDVPLNENWESIASLLETLITGARWVSGLALSQDGGLDFTIVDGIIYRNDAEENITGGSFSASNGTTVYVYINSGGAIIVANTLDVSNIFPLYMIQASGGNIVSIGDIRNKITAGTGGGGGLVWAKAPVTP